MTTCAQCQQNIPTRILIDDQWRNLQNRIHCLDCVPFTGKAGNRVNSNAKYSRETKNKNCAICNRYFKPSRNHVRCCSIACANTMTGQRKMVDWNTRTLEDSINHSTPRTRYVHVRKHARKIMDADPRKKQCEMCGFDAVIEVCHIKGIAEFTLDTTLGEINSPQNLMYLCPNHHAMMDKGILHGHITQLAE